MGKRRKKRKNPLGRAPVPPPGYRWVDKKKQANKKAARGKRFDEEVD